MTQVYSKDFICPLCKNILSNPVECSVCQQNYCKNCVQSKQLNKCHSCQVAPFKCVENKNLCRIVKNLKFHCSNGCGNFFNSKNINSHIIECNQNTLECQLCKFQGNYSLLWDHINEMHKELIMGLLTKKIALPDISTSTNQTMLNNESFKAPAIPVSNRGYNEIVYCNKDNQLNCSKKCCNSICSKNNCLCYYCMKINRQNKNLTKEELINKAGDISYFVNYNYHCGKPFKQSISNISNKTLTFDLTCDQHNFSCPNCDPLNRYKSVYLS